MKIASQFKIVIYTAALIAILLGLLVLMGWFTDNTTLIQVLPYFVPMQFNTALGFFLSGASLILILNNNFFAGKIAALIVGIMGLTTLFQYISGINIGLDELFMEHDITVKTSHPGRMASNTAFSFLLFSFAYLCINTKWQLRLSGILGAIVFGLGIVAFVGYFTGIEDVYSWGQLTHMTIHTALGFIVLGAGITALTRFIVYQQKIVSDKDKLTVFIGHAIALAITLFLIEISMPVGMVEGYTFVLLILFGWFIPKPRVILYLAIASSFLIVSAYILLKTQDELFVDQINVFLEILIVWLVALLLYNIKIKEDILIKSEYELKKAQAIANTGTFVFYVKTGFWKSSTILDTIFGIDKEYSKDLSSWFAVIHPKDIIMMQNYLLKNVMRDYKFFDKEFRIKTINNKQERWVHALGKLEFDESGELVTIAGTVNDITDRKKTEEKLHVLRAALQNSKDVIFMTDKEGFITFINPEFTNMYGYSIEEVVGKVTPRILNSKSLKKYEWEQFWNTLLNKQSVSSRIYTNKTKRGTLIEIEGSVDPIIDKNGEIMGFLSIQHDISELKKSEIKLKKALVKATESDRLKSVFLSTMSHEIRTPLNAIIGLSSLIDNDLPMDDILEFNKIIGKSGDQLLNIIEDLFSISVIEAGKSKAEKEKIELQSLLKNVNEIITVKKQKLGKNNLELNLKILPKYKKLIIISDAPKLERILVNLLKNALKFTNQGHINYGFTIETINSKKMLKFYVKDTGIGIDKKHHEFIFDSFRQVDDSYNREQEGTGLGLSTSKGLTELLGGTIWLESEKGKGSTFYFTIPFKEFDIKDKTIKTKIKETKKDKLKSKTILIVEDNKLSYKYFNIIYEEQGINTLWAKNGKKAIEFCLKHPEIDLVIMDIKMPIMDGYEATKKIKKVKPKLPIIAQTAFALSNDREKSIEAGCDDYITKPINKNLLLKLTDHYLK